MPRSLETPLRFLCLFLLTGLVTAQTGQERQEAEQLIERLAKQAIEAQELVGLAVGVVLDGEVAFTQHYGFEDREKEVPVSAQTRFRWASISKPITAVAALQLARTGKLDLDRDIREYVPEFPAKDHPITARQLLSHQGGIVHYLNGPVIRTEREYKTEHPFESVLLALDTFKESPLVAEPGTQYSYTTHGYILLSAVVERAGKQSYWEQVQQRIVERAKLASLEPDYQWTQIEHRAVGYRRITGIAVRGSNTDVSWKLGGGGYLSTVADLAGFAAALMGDGLLTEEDKAIAWAPAKLANGSSTGYGLGFGVRRENGELFVQHSGSQEKTRTMMRMLPERGLAVVLMTNSEWAQLNGPTEAMLAALTAR
ncbi:MAG: serine hydrolase [Planctomycetota bacterium]|nr:serine hydrolase [Planctomycetota bacterium]